MIEKNVLLNYGLVLIFAVAVLLLVLAGICSENGEAKTITVDDDGGANYTGIQDAINASRDGDTIRVYDGTYEGIIVVNKSVNIIGNGSETTMISEDYTMEFYVVKITSDRVNLSGFRILGNRTQARAGILVQSNCNIISDNTIFDTPFAGIQLESVYIDREPKGCSYNIIENNTCSNYSEYGIILWANNNILRNNTCSGNLHSTGIKIVGDNNTLTGNTCYNNRYGIYLWSHNNNTLKKNHFLYNRKYGIYLYNSSNNTFENNTVFGNQIGIYLWNSSRDNIVHYNNIYNNAECGVNATDNNNYTINATYNWWGDDSGSYHPIKNPTGKGDEVTDYVDFIPWLLTNPSANKIPLAFIDSITPNPGIKGQTTIFTGHGTDDDTIISYYWRSNIGNKLYYGASPTFITSWLSPGYHKIYFKVQDYYGVWSEEVSADLTILPKPPENQPPVLTILSPENNSEIFGFVSIRGTVYDQEDNSTSVEISINGGEWFRITNASTWNFQFDAQELKDGYCIIMVLAFDGQNYSATQTLNLTVKNKESEPDDNAFLPKPTHPQIIVVVVTIGSMGLVGLALLRENLRFALLSTLTIPLYTTLKKDDILNQANRQDIYSYLASNPGANYSRILRELNLGTSTLVHHLKVLEREDFIHSKKVMGRRLFYPNGSKLRVDPNIFELPLSLIQSRILDHMKNNGPASRLDIEHALSLKRQTVSYSVRRLEERGLIKCSGNGRKDMYKAIQEASAEIK